MATSAAQTTAVRQEISQRQVLQWLADTEVLQGLTDADLQGFLKTLRILNFRPGDTVIHEGKFSAALYIVTAGKFSVVRPPSPEGSPMQREVPSELDHFEPAQCFGEYSLLDRQPASASVVAKEVSQAIQIPRPAFESVLMSDYRIARTVYLNMCLMLTGRLRKSLRV